MSLVQKKRAYEASLGILMDKKYPLEVYSYDDCLHPDYAAYLGIEDDLKKHRMKSVEREADKWVMKTELILLNVESYKLSKGKSKFIKPIAARSEKRKNAYAQALIRIVGHENVQKLYNKVS